MEHWDLSKIFPSIEDAKKAKIFVGENDPDMEQQIRLGHYAKRILELE